MNKCLYYIASFTWGLIMSFIGLVVFIVLTAFGYKIQRNALGWRIEIGSGWGGFSMGPFALVCKDVDEHLCAHEFGHSIQNCIFGPFMIVFVMIPSIIRYWMYNYQLIHHQYEYIWFEQMATMLGLRYWK